MNNASEKSPFLKIAYITVTASSSHTFLDYDFFLVLEGTVRITIGKNTFFLAKDDVFLFQPGTEYQTSSAGNNVILSVIMDPLFFLKGQSMPNGHYICNSSTDATRDYKPLRQLLTRIANTYFGDTDPRNLLLTSQAYGLLYYLNTYHYEASAADLLPVNDSRHQERMRTILDYIHYNYASPITLQETADTLHLSSPYLSSFFKQNMNQNFNSYVNQVRLNHAVDELIYTDKSVTAITFDNGFASMNAFNKIFKERYNTTPNRYRQQANRQRMFTDIAPEDPVQLLPANEYHHLLDTYQSQDSEGEILYNIKFPVQQEIAVSDMCKSAPMPPIWKTLINVGSLCAFPNRDIEKQLKQIQDSTGFAYGRIEYVLDYRLFHTQDQRESPYSFAILDRTIDCFVLYGLTPYLDLSVPLDLLEVRSDKRIVVDVDIYMELLDNMMRHNANMHGPDYLETWYYEISPQRNLPLHEFEAPDSFARRFAQAYRLIKKYLPNAKVGGLCHDAILDFQLYHQMLNDLKELGITPDFVSLGVFPFAPIPSSSPEEASPGIYYTRDPHYPLHKLKQFKSVVAQYYPRLPQIHIAYLAPDVFHGHYLNDTVYQSSFFFHNTVDLIGEADMLGYYRLSDIGSTEEENLRYLEGRCGIFNKYGIRKPGAHVLDVFSNCRNHLVAKGEDYVILKGTLNRYMIGLCNYTYINEYESYTIHHQIPIEDAYKIYENPQTKNVELKLHNLAVGDYDVILFQINKQHGSILDEWARNNYFNRFDRDELEHIRKTNQPLRTHISKSTADGSMEFQFQLSPHEVVFLALLQRW